MTLELASQHKGILRPIQLAAAFGISPQTARKWLERFAGDGFFAPVALEGQIRITRYRLVYHEKLITLPPIGKGKLT